MDGITDSMDVSLRKLREIMKDTEAGGLESMALQRVRHNLATEQPPLWNKSGLQMPLLVIEV